MTLEKIRQADDIKKTDPKDWPLLAREIREFLIEKTSVHGGHLASNLGVVELTMALFLSFDLPGDKIVWDVGHQSYTHKILSGRKDAFDELRQFGGIAGFPKRNESPYDAFNTGHSSTSISAALGIAQALELQGRKERVVAVIGDGSLTGGMAYEGLNNASRMKRNFIIVLNDNEMSIARNVGGVSNYLNGIRTAEGYLHFKDRLADALVRLPGGRPLVERMKRTKDSIKKMVVPGMFFEDMGITYLGPVDGHDIRALRRAFAAAKRVDHAVLVHVVTKKGKGYPPAEENPERFHGVGPFDIATGEPKKGGAGPSWTSVFSEALCALAREDRTVAAVTAAMPDGTGLSAFAKEFPERFFDVGIAEAHAVTSAAGMAAGGLKPVVAVYSSFLQRGFDQILHDVCIQNLHVVFAVDRAGLVGADGETHQGIFDLSYLGCIPNMTVLAPKNADELADELRFALSCSGPVAVRYPRGEAWTGLGEFRAPVVNGKAEMLYEESGIALLAVGSMVQTGAEVRRRLKEAGLSCTLVNMRFIKPVDKEMLDRVAARHETVVTMEENVLHGGFGEAVGAYVGKRYPGIRVYHIALPDAYVEHGDVKILKQALRIDAGSVLRRLRDDLGVDTGSGEDDEAET